jgi:hypothetical protein
VNQDVAVEKLILGELIEDSSRQDALQAICKKQLTIYDFPKSCSFMNVEFFNTHRLINPLKECAQAQSEMEQIHPSDDLLPGLPLYQNIFED